MNESIFSVNSPKWFPGLFRFIFDRLLWLPQWRNRLARRTYKQYQGLSYAEVVSSSLTWSNLILTFQKNTWVDTYDSFDMFIG